MEGRAVLKGEKKTFATPTETNVHGDALCFMVMEPSLLQKLTVGGWWRLAVGGWWRLAAVGGWWGLVVSGWGRFAALGGSRSAVGDGWRLAVGGPWGLSFRALSNQKNNLAS